MTKLTWEELANFYNDAHNDKSARTLPMSMVFEWASKQTDRFYVSKDGTIHLVERV